jgi:tetratricopeptide (TPR) repeat protein
MKNTIIVIFMALFINVSFAQTELSKAFSESYLQEYNQDYDKSILAITNIYKVDSYEANLRLGWLHYVKADYKKSIDFYNKAILISPNSIEAKLGYIYPLSLLKEWDGVIDMYKNILKLDPNNYTAIYRLAHLYYYKKELKTAKSFAIKANNQYPFDYYINLLLGKINIDLGDKTSAKAFLYNANFYDPTSVEVTDLLKTL